MPTTETEEVTPDETESATDLGDAGKKAIASERRRADALEKELKALKLDAETRANAELSELERFKKENAELVKAQNAAALESTRLKVALEKGIPANLAARLQGDDYDSIAADADALAELVGKSPAPRPDPSQGAKSSVGAQTPAEQLAEILRPRR